MAMTEQQQTELMDQIARMYEQFAGPYHPERAAILLNGLFDIAKEIDFDKMHGAFWSGKSA